jgi:hypothetical protein
MVDTDQKSVLENIINYVVSGGAELIDNVQQEDGKLQIRSNANVDYEEFRQVIIGAISVQEIETIRSEFTELDNDRYIVEISVN